jgi:hypothetical protein
MGHGIPSPQPPLTLSPHPEFRLLYTVQPASVTYPSQSPGFVHQQSPESIIASGLRGPAGIQNAVGGTYPQQWYLIFTFFL